VMLGKTSFKKLLLERNYTFLSCKRLLQLL
jgi:hypothetical protein